MKGNNINRQMKATVRATWMHSSVSGIMGGLGTIRFVNKDAGLAVFDFSLAALAYSNMAKSVKKSISLYPQYGEIVARAKRIFKK